MNGLTHTAMRWKEDLRKFFDRYLKGIYQRLGTDTESTSGRLWTHMTAIFKNSARKRISRFQELYIKSCIWTPNRKSLSYDPSYEHTRTSYDVQTEEACFDITFDEDTEISGFMKLHLWVEAEGHDDMDLFITVQKLDENGEFIPTWVFGERHPGAWGKIRVSRRDQDPQLASDIQPVQSLTKTEKLEPGQIVPVVLKSTYSGSGTKGTAAAYGLQTLYP